MAMSSDVVRPRDPRPPQKGGGGNAPAAPAEKLGAGARLARFYHDVMGEMKRVSWPDRKTLRDATVRIIVFVLLIGAVIALVDLALQFLLVRLPQTLVGR